MLETPTTLVTFSIVQRQICWLGQSIRCQAGFYVQSHYCEHWHSIVVAVVCRMFPSKPKSSHSQTFSLTCRETAKESKRARKTMAASTVDTGPNGPKLAFPFAGALLVAALLHAVKVFVPVLSGEVFPPAVYAKEAIGTAGHIEAHLIYGCLSVGVCPSAAFQTWHHGYQYGEQLQPSDPTHREFHESHGSEHQRSPQHMGTI